LVLLNKLIITLIQSIEFDTDKRVKKYHSIRTAPENVPFMVVEENTLPFTSRNRNDTNVGDNDKCIPRLLHV